MFHAPPCVAVSDRAVGCRCSLPPNVRRALALQANRRGSLSDIKHVVILTADGAAFVASKMDAIAANPEVWAKTAFVLNDDENDGMFDHVPPPVPSPGTPDEFVGRGRIPRGVHHCFSLDRRRMGVQPAVHHASVLQFREKFTGVREPNISAHQRMAWKDLRGP